MGRAIIVAGPWAACRSLLVVFAALMMVASPAFGEDKPVLQKANVVEMFLLTKEQWNDKAAKLAEEGKGQTRLTEDGTQTTIVRFPAGWSLAISPLYQRSLIRPNAIQLAVLHPAPQGVAITDEAVDVMFEQATAEMSPEYIVSMSHQRIGDDLLLNFLIIPRP